MDKTEKNVIFTFVNFIIKMRSQQNETNQYVIKYA
jgi:hypothetical protein